MLDRGCIDSVIFFMHSDEPDVNHSIMINDQNHQPVMIAFDVKHDPVIGQKTGISVNSFDIRRTGPTCAFDIMKPGLQGNGSIRVLFPKFPQNTPADDPHVLIIAQSYQNGNNKK
jgi:hypothetical protein